jgi:hypothetical protein
MRASRATLAPISRRPVSGRTDARPGSNRESDPASGCCARSEVSRADEKARRGRRCRELSRQPGVKARCPREESPIFLTSGRQIGSCRFLLYWSSGCSLSRNHTTADVWSLSPRPSDRRVGASWAPAVTAWNIGSFRLGIAISYLAPPPDRSKPVDLRWLAAFAQLLDGNLGSLRRAVRPLAAMPLCRRACRSLRSRRLRSGSSDVRPRRMFLG